jgi:hypothetical protein
MWWNGCPNSFFLFLWSFGRRYSCLVGSGVCRCCSSKFSEDIQLLAWRCPSKVGTCCQIKDMTLTDCVDENLSFYNTYELFSLRTFGLNLFLRTWKSLFREFLLLQYVQSFELWNNEYDVTSLLNGRFSCCIFGRHSCQICGYHDRFFVASLSYSRQTPRQ